MSVFKVEAKTISTSPTYSPRRIRKAIRRLRQPQSDSSIELDSTFQNIYLSNEIEKRNSSNNTSIVNFEGFSGMQFKNSKPEVHSNKSSSNILGIENLLFSNFFRDISINCSWNQSPKTLRKVVELYNGKRFVRLEYASNHLSNFPEQRYSKKCTNYGDIEYTKQNLSNECRNKIRERHHTRNFIRQDEFNISENSVISSKSNNSSCLLSIQNRPESSDHLPPQSQNEFSTFVSNTKVSPTEIYQICLVMIDKPISYVWESVSEEFEHDTEFLFDTDYSSVFDPVKDEKTEDSDKLIVEDACGTTFDRSFSEIKVPESSEDLNKMMAFICGGLENCEQILGRLEETSELIKKELSLPSLNFKTDVTDCLIAPEIHLGIDFNRGDFFNSCVNKTLKQKCCSPFSESLNIQEAKRDEFVKLLDHETPTYEEEKFYKLLKHLTTIDEENTISSVNQGTLNNKTSSFGSSKWNSQDSYVDLHCKLRKFGYEREEKLLSYPSKFTLLLLDNILLRLQSTYQTVNEEVHSWLLPSETDQKYSKSQNIKNGNESVWTSTEEHDCFADGKYIIKFKGRNTDTAASKYYEWEWPSSDFNALSFPEENEPDDSDLDASESSLEGSYKNRRTDSRASTISSGDESNDFCDIPRFSLPSRKSNGSKVFYTKKNELLDEVSSKEWSLVSAETEISVKCTRRRRRFRSEEHRAQDGLGISNVFMKDNLGIPIPEDFLRDFDRAKSLSENISNVEHESGVDT